jgi:fumarate reductase subunit C
MNSVITVTLIPIVSFIIGNLIIDQLAESKNVRRVLRHSQIIKDKLPLNFRIYGYNKSHASEYWRVLTSDESALKSEGKSLRLDFFFILLYGLTTIYSSWYLWNTLDKLKPLPIVLILLPIIITMIADCVENTTLLKQLEQFTKSGDEGLQYRSIRLASIATQVKLVSFVIAYLVLFWLAIKSLN